MISKILAVGLIVLVVSVISFFIWHFVFSIYEVKYKFGSDPDNLKLNKVYSIKGFGLNALGWEMNFRELHMTAEIEDNNYNIKLITTSEKNQVVFETLKTGIFTVLINSKYSISQSRLEFRILNN